MNSPDERWLYAWGVGSVGFGTASLLVPLYIVQLGGGPELLGVQAAVAALLGTLGAFSWGWLSDRTDNHRLLLAIGLVTTTVTFLLLPLLTSPAAIILANGVIWFAFSSAAPVLTVLVVANVEPSEWDRRIGRLNAFQGYGWAAGLVLGAVWMALLDGVLTSLTAQRWLLGFSGLLTGVSTLLALRWLPSSSADVPTFAREIGRLSQRGITGFGPRLAPHSRSRLSQVLRRPPSVDALARVTDRFTPLLSTYFAAVALFFAGFGVFFAPLPAYLTSTGYTSDGVFALYVVAAVASALSYVAAGQLTSEYDHVPSFHAGALGVRAIALPIVALVGSQFSLEVPGYLAMGAVFAVMGFSWAFIAVTGMSLVSRLAPPPIRGEALGVYLALSAAAGGVGNLVGGWLAGQFDYTITFTLAAVLVLVGAAVVATVRGLSPDIPAHGTE